LVPVRYWVVVLLWRERVGRHREQQRLRKFFDRYWRYPSLQRWDRYHPLVVEAGDLAFDWIDGIAPRRVLEVGPGDGVDTERLVLTGASVTCVDLSWESMHRCSERTRGTVTTAQMAAEQMAFKDACFDLVFLRTTLMHLDRQPFFEECIRVLKPGGSLVFIEPLRDNPFVVLYRVLLSPSRVVHPRYATLGELVGYGEGFGRVEHREFFLFSFIVIPLGMVARCLSRLGAPLVALDRCLFQWLPWTRRFSWLTVMWMQRTDGPTTN
jgi:SAM-dependent methyltransferase